MGDEFVITWAVGHLVGLAEPDAYDPKLRKWRYADLPIVPEKFKLVPIDDRAAKQLKAIHKLMKDPEIERIVNACDAGREGELIFAYVFDTAGVDKPVDRLWLSSMTKRAITEAFESLRPGEEMKPLEDAARSRSEADWLVGMNSTRAASIRLRAAFDGAVSLGRVQTPTLTLVAKREEEIRAFKPEPYWLVEAQLRGLRRAPLRRPLPRRAPARRTRTRPRRWSPPWRATRARSPSWRRRRRSSSRSSSTTSPRSSATPTRSTASRRGARSSAAQRLYEEHKALTYPRTNSRYLTGDMVAEIKPTAELVGHNPQYTKARRVRDSRSTACRSSAWSTTRRSRTTTRSSPRAPSTTSAAWARTS